MDRRRPLAFLIQCSWYCRCCIPNTGSQSLSPPTFVVHIDTEEVDLSGDARLTLRALREDLEQLLERHALRSHRSTKIRPGRIICAIVTATQYLRKLRHTVRDPELVKLIQDHYRLIVIDDRSLYLPDDVQHVSAEDLADLQRSGHLVTDPARREIGGVKQSNLLREAGVETLLAEVLNITPFFAG
jgi:hypothetical protein